MSDISALLLLKNRRNVHDKLQFPINPGADLKKFSATVAAISQDTSRCINEVTEYVLRIKEEVASLRLVLEQFNVQLGTKIKDAFDSVLTIGIQDSNGLGLRYQLKEKNLDLKRAKHVAELQRCAKKQQDLMESINKIDGLIIRVEEEGIFSLDDIDNTNDSIIRWKIYIEKQQQMRLAEEEKRRREKEEKERKEKERKRKEDKEKIRLKEIERQRLEEEQRRQEEMLKQKQEEERRRKEEEEKQRIEEEKKRLEEEKKRQDEERQRKEEEDRRQREKEERRRMEEERKHLEEQKRQLEEERRRIEEAEKRRHEEEKRRREEEERKRIEEERRLREEEEQRRKEEEERKRQQEEERRRHEEEERKRKEEETRKRKEEEERKRIEEEKKRIEEERKRIEEERQRIEDERKRREEEERMRPIIEARRREEAKRRRDPNNWPTYVYDRPKVNDSFHNGVCCAVSAITGEQGLDRDDIECRFSDRQDDLSRALADKHEQPLSSLVSIRSKQGMQIDLEMAMYLYIPYTAVQGHREVKLKISKNGGKWQTTTLLQSHPIKNTSLHGIQYGGTTVNNFKTIEIVAISKPKRQYEPIRDENSRLLVPKTYVQETLNPPMRVVVSKMMFSDERRTDVASRRRPNPITSSSK